MNNLKNLVRLARAASKSAARAAKANRAWRDAFELEFGHDDISDSLVEMIDYAAGDEFLDITAEVILANSERGLLT